MIGRRIIWKTSVASTNEYIHQYAIENSAEEGLCVFAYQQTAGKGTGENLWLSQDGKNITFSFIIFPTYLDAQFQFKLNQAVSVAILDYLAMHKLTRTSIKWPNDIYVNNRKIAGILIQLEILEKKILQAIIGIGVNINEKNIGQKVPGAISLSDLTGLNYLVEKELIHLTTFLDQRIKRLRTSREHENAQKYLECLYQKNEWKRYQIDQQVLTAKITDVNASGQLNLQDTSGRFITCSAKEIEFL